MIHGQTNAVDSQANLIALYQAWGKIMPEKHVSYFSPKDSGTVSVVPV